MVYYLYHIVICILLFFIFVLKVIEADTGQSSKYSLIEYPDIKYCFSSMDLLDGSPSSNLLILKRDLGKNCTHVYGNIVISNIFRSVNGSEPSLEFLSTIKEVTGSLKIRNTNLSIIPLNNLRVIRGDSNSLNREWPEGPRNALEISWDDNLHKLPQIPTIIDLRSLRSIVNGNIQISSMFCGSLANIDWDELIEDPNRQRVSGNCSPALFQCSKSCPVRNFTRFCWGALQSQCQIFSKCQKRMCANRCFLSKNGDEECCNSQCLGGCSSSTADSCIACQGVLDGSFCQPECPQKYISNRDNGIKMPNKYFRPLFVNLCLSKCPDNLLEQEGECKTQCTFRKYERKGNQCVPCKGFCEHICTVDDIFTENEKFFSLTSLDSVKIKKLENCTSFKGSIQMDIDSFKQPISDNSLPITDSRDLWFLHKLRHISGSVYIDLKYAKFKLDNLSFLSNLEIIEGGHNKKIPVSLGIYNTNISFLGLTNLKSIGLKGQKTSPIVLKNHSNLCYFDEKKFQQFLKFDSDITAENLATTSFCEKHGKVCSKECDPSLGCWGPGPTQCIACLNMKLGNTCAKNCSIEPGYLTNFDSKINVCLKCHEECAKTCTGVRPNQCIGGCKHAMENRSCVSKCSRTYYLNNVEKKCEPCHPDCHPRNLTKYSVCTGPSYKPGPGGCNKCQSLILANVGQQLEPIKCFNKPYLLGYFNENHPYRKNTQFSDFTEKFTDLIVTFQPCYPLCSKCTFLTDQRIKVSTTDWSGCTQCKGYWYENTCVLSCPSNVTYLKADKTKTSLGICVRCNSQCNGCYGDGNDKCNNCINFRFYDNKNVTQFSCVENCPPKYEQGNLKSNLNQSICVFVLLTKLELILVILAIIFFIFLLLFAIIITTFIHVKKEKRREEKLKDYFSNVNEKDSHDIDETDQPNMNFLLVISSDNLEFYSGSEILGKGTFGAVYLGKWKPESDYFDDSSSMNSCKDKKLDVVIKVLNGSCDQNEFMEEVKIMASVRHKHCLRLIGVSFKNQQKLLISSYMPLGSMDKYLKQNTKTLTNRILLLWAEQIANGMVYLEKTHIIHRDLATRNVLIYKENHVLITDFGLSKIIKANINEIQIFGGMVPVRWLAIETLREGIYSHKTDVWAYAVTLWEIFTFAKIPYDPIKANEVRDEIIKGNRLCQPEICSLDIYILMLKCWSIDPEERPNFTYLWTEFKRYSSNPQTYLSYPNIESEYKQNSPNNYIDVNTDDNELDYNKRFTEPYWNEQYRHKPPKIVIPDEIKPLLLEQPKRNPMYESAYEPSSANINLNGSISLHNGKSNFHRNEFQKMSDNPPSPFTREYLEPLTTRI